jgi:quinol monooxygenase YgiN
MREAGPELVTLHLWRVPRRAVPAAVVRMGVDRRAVRGTAGVRFAKLLGTGDGGSFRVRDADPRRWGLLASWADRAAARAFERSAVAARWRRLAEETWRVELRPLSSHGRWSGQEPFGRPTGGTASGPADGLAGRGSPGAAAGSRWDGPVAAVTRARLRPSRARSFRRAVPAVAADLRTQPGLRLAVGIGEAPVGLLGTFSVWESTAALRRFAYAGAAHRAVVARTLPERWYAEELFARFAIEAADGTVDGRDPLA